MQMDRDDRVTTCCPRAIKKAGAARPTMTLWTHLKGAQLKRVGLLQLVQHHCHIFVRQNKCLCKENYTQVLMPTSYHPSNRENTSTLQQLGLCLLKWLDSSQRDNAHSPDILIYFRFFKSSTSERTYFRLFFDWEAGKLGALFHLTERRWKHLLSFRTIQRKHYTCE